MKLGNLEIGTESKKNFGKFLLTWKVNTDHVAWAISTDQINFSGPKNVNSGILQPNVNNRPYFSYIVDFANWPDMRNALDFIYNLSKEIS